MIRLPAVVVTLLAGVTGRHLRNGKPEQAVLFASETATISRDQQGKGRAVCTQLTLCPASEFMYDTSPLSDAGFYICAKEAHHEQVCFDCVA